MSHFATWLLCCAIIGVTMLVARPEAPISAVSGVFLFMGAPLMLHWLFN